MRSEFPAKVRSAAFTRCGGRCEKCTAKLRPGKFAYDHIVPDALGGPPTLDNCQVLCDSCHGEKTGGRDVPQIAKGKRQRAYHIGAKSSGRGFATNRTGKFKKRMDGTVELRRPHAPPHHRQDI